MTREEVDQFISRYVSMWHEPDPQTRRQMVVGLWAENAENHTSQYSIRGHDEIIPRVTRAYENFVAGQGYSFRPAGNTDWRHNVIKFFWEMLPQGGGPIEARGLDIFVLNEDGRIGALYQFAEPMQGR